MKILVINGSPKGKNSITLHTCLFLEKKFPGHTFTYIDAGQKIKALEKDFSPALEAVRDAELIVFCYPVYTFLVPSQLHRFIELLKAAKIDLSGKTATQVTTSKHFYDITAHRFIEDNCADHKFFKSHGQYDFPQKKWKTSWMMYLIGGMMNNPKLKRKMGGKMSEGMIAPYKMILED